MLADGALWALLDNTSKLTTLARVLAMVAEEYGEPVDLSRLGLS